MQQCVANGCKQFDSAHWWDNVSNNNVLRQEMYQKTPENVSSII